MTDCCVLDRALAHISDIDTAGELPLTVRQMLRESLVHLLRDDERGLTFVALLGLTCAKRAWPVWRTAFPLESRPMDFAEVAVSSISERASIGVRDVRELMEVKTELDDKLLLGQEYFPAVCAGFASWAVARDVISSSGQKFASGETELKIPPEEWDPCFFASLAITGGATWEGIQRPDRRREFWGWYLTSAVPGAFAAAADR